MRYNNTSNIKIEVLKAWRNEKIISERISVGFSTFPGEISVKKAHV